jgi:hypothetical protein|tara:strand:- start:237 stop:407 length:171 start_codon:yes stop_codon:yes gene_type:complete
MAMLYPKLQVVKDKNGGKVWRVTYAGMIKEHTQEWQAKVWFQEALQLYARRQRNEL